MKPYVICYRGVAHTWMCDHLGHLNTRHYTAAFDDAMQHFFSILGYKRDPGYGWADVKHQIEYLSEIRPGELIHVECALIRVGKKAVTYEQRLVLTDKMEVAAKNTATSVLFDIGARVAVEAPAIIYENGAEYTVTPSTT